MLKMIFPYVVVFLFSAQHSLVLLMIEMLVVRGDTIFAGYFIDVLCAYTTQTAVVN